MFFICSGFLSKPVEACYYYVFCSNAVRRLAQRNTKTDNQREEMYIFTNEAADLDDQLGACAKRAVSLFI